MRKKHSQSFTWRGILDSRDILIDGIRWIIGDENLVLFWKFNWLLPFPLLHLFLIILGII